MCGWSSGVGFTWKPMKAPTHTVAGVIFSSRGYKAVRDRMVKTYA